MEEEEEAPLLLPTRKSEVVGGVSDYRGRPVYRGSSGGWRSALFVVAVEIAGSFAYFGVSANLITYLTGPLGHSNAAAAAAVNAWSGTASLMPLLGAFLADAYLGRYRSIILAGALYVLGYGLLTLSATLVRSSLGLFYMSLYLIAVAQGADKPCGLAFAADQFDPEHPKERASRGSLFNWWFFCMAIGISVAVSVVGYIQDNVGWGAGFGVPCAIVFCAFVVFLLGTPTYRLPAPPPCRLSSPFQANLEAKNEEARCVLRLLPIWASSLAYGVVYAQIMTLFNKQGRTLDRRTIIGLELPPAALQALGPLSILLFVPLYDRALVPALRRVTGHPSGLTMLQRVGAGMATSLAAVSVAALVEGRRLATARDHGLVDDPGATVPMSWAWLVPQYAVMGLADVLAVVGLQELFYDQMPHGLRSLGLALYLSVMGIGGFISSLLISLIDALTSATGDSWFADNLNRAHLDYFYWLLAALSAAELVLFLAFARSYVYNNKIISITAQKH
ncbi:hypothetical protein EJB05_40281 [Eragrostis curvula]|uniref:Major facilitator superfamily (MFS) profile domain-containing protein n=1 Tax=Eragrostis curvula TaxID=38414 RepID=A0A5J9TZE8_9POAL|nr:hypothetical protein EJB05_40281 [Eragrostis curvula]